MLTLRQIADTVGCSKQQAYRAVKDLEIDPAEMRGQTAYYDDGVLEAVSEAVASTPKARSAQDQAPGDDGSSAVMALLQDQIAVKDGQIAALQTQVEGLTAALQAAQALQAALIPRLTPPPDEAATVPDAHQSFGQRLRWLFRG